MTFGLCFYVLMVLWFASSLWSADFKNLKQSGGSLILFLILLLLGYKLFGPPLHD